MELKDFATINFEIKYSSSAFKHGMTEADKSLAKSLVEENKDIIIAY